MRIFIKGENLVGIEGKGRRLTGKSSTIKTPKHIHGKTGKEGTCPPSTRSGVKGFEKKSEAEEGKFRGSRL